jgi:hypothetical protein
MKVETIYLNQDSGFATVIKDWAKGKNIEALVIDIKSIDLIDTIDGVAIFHENHNILKEQDEIQEYLNNHNRPGHRIDINGTLAATKSNFTMWVERNKTKRILLLGSPDISKNINLKRFIDSLDL